jgi:hypothetical protein
MATVLLACATAGIWRIATDERAPNWDESSYLIRAVTGISDLRPPGATYLLWLPAVLQPSTGISLDVYAAVMWCIFLVSVAVLSLLLLPASAAPLAVIIAGTSCTIFSLSSRLLVDLPLATAVVAAVAAAIMANRRRTWHYAVACGVLVGMALLFKPTALAFVAPALLVLAVPGTWRSGPREAATGVIAPRADSSIWRLRGPAQVNWITQWSLTVGTTVIVVSTWYIANFQKVLSYYQIADGPLDSWYQTSPPDVGSFRAYHEYFDLLTHGGMGYLAPAAAAVGLLVGFLLLACAAVLASSLRFRRRSPLAAMVEAASWRTSIRRALPAAVIGLAFVVPAFIVFGASNFWEIRYMTPAIVGLALTLAALVAIVPSAWAAYSAVLVLLVIWIPQATVLSGDPSSWSRSSQRFFYGTPNRQEISNLWLETARAGVEPTVGENRTRSLLATLPQTDEAPLRLGLLIAHPEASELAIQWESYVEGRDIESFEIPTSRLQGTHIVAIPPAEILANIQCMDYVVPASSPEAIATPPQDYVQWMNHFFHKPTRLTTVAEPYAEVQLSETRAVSTVNTQTFTIWKIRAPQHCRPDMAR